MQYEFSCMYISYLCLCVAECWSLPEHLQPRVCLHPWELSRSPLKLVCALCGIYVFVYVLHVCIYLICLCVCV